MIEMSVKEIAEAIRGTLKVSGRAASDLEHTRVKGAATDSRSLRPGDVFFALTYGERDGHAYLGAAAAAGASAMVVSDVAAVPPGFAGAVIEVDDTLWAFQELAGHHRDRVDPVVIGVTGSAGKTTLKDMIYHIAGTVYKAEATEGNYNNEIGAPMTLLSMPEDTEVLVLEMGMSAPGEIRRLAEIARPDIGIITNIGLSHREFFDSDEGILLAKMEIAELFGEDNILVINGNDEALLSLASLRSEELGYRLITVVSDEAGGGGGDYRVKQPYYDEEGRLSFTMENEEETERFILSTPGGHIPMAAGLAAAASACIDIELNAVSLALRGMKAARHRMEIFSIDDGLLIDDSYNASPASMENGLRYLCEVAGERRSIAVLADMNELGDASPELHEAVGATAARLGTDIVITYGAKAKDIAAGAIDTGCATTAKSFDDREALIRHLLEIKQPQDVIYVKGSNSMGMKEVAKALLER